MEEEIEQSYKKGWEKSGIQFAIGEIMHALKYIIVKTIHRTDHFGLRY